MENTSKTSEFSHEEGLKIIYEMIESAKSNIGRNYFYSFLWGYLVFLASIGDYILITIVHYNYHFLVWPVLMGIGTIATIVFGISQKKVSRHKTFIGNFMWYLWGGWFISFVMLLIFVNIQYFPVITLVLSMWGLALFASGGVVKFRPWIIGAIVSWAGAVISFFCPYTVDLLIEAGVAIVSVIIPGYILRAQSKKMSHVS